MKKERINIASNTLQIIEKGFYEKDNERIEVAKQVTASIANAILYTPDQLNDFVEQTEWNKSFATQLKVTNESTMDAAITYAGKSKNLGVLNFASAKNPGGGFLNGAQSQEESIARSSSLYPSIDQFQEMYKHNRKHKTYLYSDYMIYSPKVVVFKNDDGALLEQPYLADVLTSPAVNIGAILSNKPKEMKSVEGVMLQRIDKMLGLFASKGCDNLILGAWGCGVFRNNPEDMCNYFLHFLKAGAKYDGVFNTIVFAVLDRNDRGIYRAFKKLAE
ncbi:MAG: TIGR02452 family protein [Crocinitomix sp.]|nr:TIGR02452 family protein [Crocinitomix sp.]